ncbi:hypothetical protein M514_11286 [Trichuris suis]|uniref:Uncharacterized protein n=1 Tax=Trichuris suis TaxID=68888 RepID=A0A085MXS7_9BILA|nr:hypothetical protein M513_11286 [Trichuris suis]KFD62023.1 hypothetical protein M514_11286 [Trichuris suis]
MYKSPMDAEHGLIEDPRAPDKFVLETESDSYGPGTAQVLRRYPRVQGNRLGLCTQTKASLSLKPETRPVFRPKRPVPYAALSNKNWIVWSGMVLLQDESFILGGPNCHYYLRKKTDPFGSVRTFRPVLTTR